MGITGTELKSRMMTGIDLTGKHECLAIWKDEAVNATLVHADEDVLVKHQGGSLVQIDGSDFDASFELPQRGSFEAHRKS